MGLLEEFRAGVTTITQPGNHDYDEAVKRTPKGFILTKLYRSQDYYHWSAEYTQIDEWINKGGIYNQNHSSKKSNMGNLLYIVAVVLVILWAIGFLGYAAGGLIHVLLVIAIIAFLLRIIRGDDIHKS